MMLLDYFLTVWGAILGEKKYEQHFKKEHYELNPIWQKSIKQRKWFNPKHAGIVTAFTAFCILWSIGWNAQDDFEEGLFGFATVLYASIIGLHLSNICTFRYFQHHPECVSGQVTMSHLLSLNLAQFRCLALFIPLALIAVFSPSPFVVGAAFSQIFLFFLHFIWIAKTKAQLRKANPA